MIFRVVIKPYFNEVPNDIFVLFTGYCNCDQQQTNVSNQRRQKGAQHQKQQLWRQFVKQTFEKKVFCFFSEKITSCWKNSCWGKNYYLSDHMLIVNTWEEYFMLLKLFLVLQETNINYHEMRFEKVALSHLNKCANTKENKKKHFILCFKQGCWKIQLLGKVMHLGCCIFRPAFGCCALQTLVEIVIFSIFVAKNLKKQEICGKFQQKNSFFLSLHQNTGLLF